MTTAAPSPTTEKTLGGKLKSLLGLFNKKKVKEMDLGNKNKYVFDKKTQRWVIPGQEIKDDDNAPPPPTGEIAKGSAPTQKNEKKGRQAKKVKSMYTTGDVQSEEPSTEHKNEDEFIIPDKREDMKVSPFPSTPLSTESNNEEEVLRREIRELRAKNGNLQQQLDEARQKVAQAEFLLQDCIDEYETEYLQIEENTKTWSNEKAVMSVDLQAKEKEILEHKDRIASLEQTIEELKKEREDYLQMLSKDDDQFGFKDGISSEEEEAPEDNKRLIESEEQIFQLQCKLKEYEHVISKNKASIERLKGDLEQSQRQACEAVAKVKEMAEDTTKTEEVIKLANICKASEEEARKSKKILQDKEQSIAKLQGDNKKLANDNSDLRNTLAKYKDEWKMKKEKLMADIKAKEKEIVLQVEEMEKVRAELASTENLLQDANNEKNRVKKELEDSKRIYEESVKSQVNELERKLSQVNEELERSKLDIKAKEKDNIEEKAKYKDEVKKMIEENEKRVKDLELRNKEELDQLELKYQKEITQMEVESKDSIDKIKKEYTEKNSKLENEIKKQLKDNTTKRINPEDEIQIRDYYEKEIATLYTSLTTDKEIYYAQHEKKVRKLLQDKEKAHTEIAELRETNDLNEQILNAFIEKYTDIERICDIESTKEYADIFISMDKLCQYISELQEEVKNLHKTNEMTENMNCILQSCLSENKAELERQTFLMEEKANEVQYYFQLSQAYEEELTRKKVAYEERLYELESELEAQGGVQKEITLSERKIKALEASNAEIEEQLLSTKKDLNEALRREEVLSKNWEKERNMYKRAEEKQRKELINLYTGSIRALEDERNTLEEKRKSHENQINILMQKLAKTEAEKHKLDKDVKDSKVKENELNKTIEGLMTQLETERGEYNNANESLEEKLQKLSLEKSSSNESIKEYEKRLSEAKTEAANYERQIKELKRKQTEMTSETHTLRIEYETKIEELNGEMIGLQGELNKLAQENKSLLQKATLYDNMSKEDALKTVKEIEQKNIEIIELEVQLSRYKNMVTQLETMNNSLKGKVNNMDNLRYELIAMKEGLLRTKNEYKLKFQGYESEFLKCRNNIKHLIDTRTKHSKPQNEKQILQKYQNDTYALQEKLKSYGEDFKSFYSDFNSDYIQFPFYVVDKMIAYISSLKGNKPIVRPGIIRPTPVNKPVVEKLESEKSGPDKLEPENRPKTTGLTGWLTSFFLTDKEINSLKEPQDI